MRKKSKEKKTKNFDHSRYVRFWTSTDRMAGSNPVDPQMHVLVFLYAYPAALLNVQRLLCVGIIYKSKSYYYYYYYYLYFSCRTTQEIRFISEKELHKL